MTKMNKYAATRVDKLNTDIDDKMGSVEESLDELDTYLNSCIELLSERMMSSTDVGHVLALARLLDQKLELNKRKTDLIKMRISDKATELGSQKKSAGSQSIDDLLAGVQSAAALGAGLGAGIGAAKATKELADKSEPVVVIDTSEMDIESIDVTPDANEDIENMADQLVTVQMPKKK